MRDCTTADLELEFLLPEMPRTRTTPSCGESGGGGDAKKRCFFPEKHFSCFDLDIMISICILSLEKRETHQPELFCVFLYNLELLWTVI